MGRTGTIVLTRNRRTIRAHHATEPTDLEETTAALARVDSSGVVCRNKPNVRPSFRQIHERTGTPINYQKVVAGVGPVDKDEIMKGFEFEKGDYVLLSDAEGCDW